MDLNEAFHKHTLCEWALLKRFSRSEVRGHEQTN